jgi:hypothetical protein
MGDSRACTDMDEVAKYEQHVTSINSILSDLALTPRMGELKHHATCYAQRYKHLSDAYCQGDLSKCSYGSLYNHYIKHGSAQKLTWECDPKVSEDINLMAMTKQE